EQGHGDPDGDHEPAAAGQKVSKTGEVHGRSPFLRTVYVVRRTILVQCTICQVAEAGTHKRATTAPHAPLSKERVLHVAVALADEGGLAALSMRKLAEQLGAGAMSLYHYVPNKDALLDEMVDAIFARIEAPTLEDDWKTALRKRAISTRAALTRHPWALDVMESRTTPGMANLQLHNAVLACL